MPGAFGIDDTPDHSALWVGTLIGDVYSLDPVGMTVTHRYMGSQIGTAGYPTQSVQVLADGRLALIGEYNAVDGANSVGVWNPVDNSLTVYGAYQGQGGEPCEFFTNFEGFSRTVDRSRILLGTLGSAMCALDPSTGNYVLSAGAQNSIKMTTSPDGHYIILPSYPTGVMVLDAHSLATVNQFDTMGEVADGSGLVVSADSQTLFVPSASIIYAYSIATGQLVGWVSNLYVEPDIVGVNLAFGPIDNPYLLATDGSGLFAGPLGQGIGFVDLSALNTGPVGTQFQNAVLSPATGPVSGGTATKWQIPNPAGALSNVYFGSNQATAISESSGYIHATSPAGSGAVDVYAFLQDGSLQVAPEAFSYGPTVLEVTPNMSTAEGGGTGYIYGYGFGPTNSNTIPADLQVTVNGAPVAVTAFTGEAYPVDPPPFPLQSIAYTIPPGASGSAVNVTVTTGAGSATASTALSYLPPTQQFPLAGASLAQGIYDSYTDLYYFTDTTQVRVFSRTQGQWLPSISITPPPGTNENLWGIALSPDGSKMAVSDATAGAIYVFNPANPGTVQTFMVGSTYPFLVNPCGLAISNAGIVYYWVYVLGQGGGADQFFKLNTNTGAIHDYGVDGPGNGMQDLYLRNAISADGSTVYNGQEGAVLGLDTVTDQITYALDDDGCCYGNYELSLSSNQMQLTATNFLYDNLLNGVSTYALNDRESLNLSYIYGAKVNYDGRLIFQPSSNGIDVLDGNVGNLRRRIALPVALSANYDALAVDPNDNVLIAITGNSGDGIAIVDLTSLPEPTDLFQSIHQGRTPISSIVGNALTGTSNPTRRKQTRELRFAGYPKMISHVTNAMRRHAQR